MLIRIVKYTLEYEKEKLGNLWPLNEPYVFEMENNPKTIYWLMKMNKT